MRENKKKRSEFSESENFFYKYILFILDYLLFLGIIPICGIAFWVSTYYCLQLSQSPDKWFIYAKYALISLCAIIYAFMHSARVSIYKIIRDHVTSEVTFFVVSKLYIYIFSLCGTVVFVAVFETQPPENSFGTRIPECAVMTALGFLILFYIKCRPHLAGGVGDVGKEKTPEDVFLFPVTLFGTSWKKNKLLYILDSIFSVFIVGTLVILVWRGAWCLLDQTIYPGDETYVLSGWISLGIGYSIVFTTFALQRLMKILIRKYHGWKRLVIIDTYVVVSFCGTINIWRGIWILLEVFADLEKSIVNCLILHFLSFFILVIFNSSNTLLVRGVYIDAEENGEDCVEFPCYYFRLRFQEKQKKKTLVELNMANTKINNIMDDKDNNVLNDHAKKPETEIITELNPQHVPLILNTQNPNGNLGSNVNEGEKLKA